MSLFASVSEAGARRRNPERSERPLVVRVVGPAGIEPATLGLEIRSEGAVVCDALSGIEAQRCVKTNNSKPFGMHDPSQYRAAFRTEIKNEVPPEVPPPGEEYDRFKGWGRGWRTRFAMAECTRVF